MKRLKSAIKKLIVIGLFAYAALVATLYFSQRSLIYHPNPATPDPAMTVAPEMTAQRLQTADGPTPLAWWAPPADPGRPTIVYFQGNSGTVADRAGRARLFLDAGYGVLLAGYRYNAGAGGEPSEEGLVADGRAAFDFALSQGIAPNRIVLYGESLGTGIAVVLASEHAVGALVLEMPYSSVADVAQERFWYVPARWLVKDEFDSQSRIARIKAPLLVIHGEKDTLIPVKFGRKLFDAANEPKEGFFLPEGDHGNLYNLGAGQMVLDFLARRFESAGAPVQ